MIYIDGLGYVEEPTTITPPTSSTPAENTVSFDEILQSKTASDSASTTYTLKEIFEEAAEKYGLPENLLETVAYYESGFNPDSTSSSGAMGIMQLMPGTAAELGVTDAYDAYQNIMGGAKYLKQLYDSYDGNLSLTLAAYNAGSGTVAKYGGVPDIASVQSYVAKILDTMQAGVNVPDTTVSVNTDGTSSLLSLGTGASIKGATNYLTGGTGSITEVVEEDSDINNTQLVDLLKQILGSDNFYYSSNLDSALSYSEYQVLMNYYDTMLDTISSIGSSDDDDDDDDSSSLTDLYQLGVKQTLGLTDSSSSSSVSSATIAKVAEAYASSSSLLDL